MRTTRGTGGSYCNSQQRIEDVRTFAGQTVTLSFWAKASASCTIEPFYIQTFGSGGSGAVSGSFGTTTTLTTSWVRYSYTVAIPSVSGKTIGAGSYLNILVARITSATNVDVDTWGIQVEAGSVATAFQTATGTLQGELAACQRYYWRQNADDTNTNFAAGQAYSTTAAVYTVTFPVPMRVKPTVLDYSNLCSTNSTLGTNNITNLTTSYGSNMTYGLIGTTTGLVAGNATGLFSTSARPSYIGLGAEL